MVLEESGFDPLVEFLEIVTVCGEGCPRNARKALKLGGTPSEHRSSKWLRVVDAPSSVSIRGIR